ncbi:VirB3 family type IV secretion system protein (plasmid) [Xylella taiwanensis]|uniref:VirB3 family type IV secretion system protein n=1 Tax=Xylella taiwanensis TaxID=1444770 RepID=A0ABS8TYN6_9GAMM|nr:VirB3 family type IV secretion system protein [Xylella taiwanensis]MCD8459780.1 VirB3 family type IV secretion system protein [Xylella taiwanensis]MCD8474169.1 VirB3 family type IV secretion system protein [Xylella taiwanensis]UFN08049.1 VirB3 family type IV secretion system protein [Xylella taiwanensis]UFN10342.1 VirB3 family type IV secretion system protein [Xylella taiwanensis]UFN12630.1 VirB3 family type IV secretion system protein [Xylella taiwanensis]
MIEEQPPEEYISYNGLGRSPMIWGIPYMVGLVIMSLSLLGGVLIGTFVGGVGWLFSLIGVPMALFVKIICTNDDKAIQILKLEVKWTILKALCGNAKYHGGTMAIAPITYGRKLKNVKRYFKKTVCG